MGYILAFDLGTTSCRSIIFDRDGSIVSKGQSEFLQIFPRAGWVEHDPQEIFRTQVETAIDALQKAGLTEKHIDSVGITNQRETTVIWDRRTGEPIYNAIVWQDRRTSEFCDQIRADHASLIREKTGLEVDAYFSASKVKWLLDNVEGARSRAMNGELAFGTVDTWLVWKLTGGMIHTTDPSNASRTMLYDINTGEWDEELLHIYGIPHMILPTISSSSEILGEIREPLALKGIKIGGVAGDQQAALFGQGCFEKGSTKCTYGTGCFLLQNTGEAPVTSSNRLLTTVGWDFNGKAEYALEGSIFIGGAVIQWLRDSLMIIKSASEVEKLAVSVPDSGGVFFVPAFVGLGAPYWDQRARGTIVGLTRGTGRAHLARAALEAIAYQTADLLASMNADSRMNLEEIRVDGGAVENELLMQFQADILQLPVVRSRVRETTALGAAYLSGLATGFWSSRDEVIQHWKSDRIFKPSISHSRSEELKARWHEAVERSMSWAK